MSYEPIKTLDIVLGPNSSYGFYLTRLLVVAR